MAARRRGGCRILVKGGGGGGGGSDMMRGGALAKIFKVCIEVCIRIFPQIVHTGGLYVRYVY